MLIFLSCGFARGLVTEHGRIEGKRWVLSPIRLSFIWNTFIRLLLICLSSGMAELFSMAPIFFGFTVGLECWPLALMFLSKGIFMVIWESNLASYMMGLVLICLSCPWYVATLWYMRFIWLPILLDIIVSHGMVRHVINVGYLWVET